MRLRQLRHGSPDGHPFLISGTDTSSLCQSRVQKQQACHHGFQRTTGSKHCRGYSGVPQTDNGC